MQHEGCNGITVTSISINDDIALSPQQCNIIKIPYPLPITHEYYNEITENSPKRIPDFYKYVIDKIPSYKELILMKE